MKAVIGIAIASVAIMKFLNLYLGIAFLLGGIFLFVLLKQLGYLRGIEIYTKYITEGVVYVKDYKGDYNSLEKEFQLMHDILTKFKKEKDYQVIGIYYDNPAKKKNVENCRASIGIMKKKMVSNFKFDADLEEYAKENNLVKHIVPKCKCLFSQWEYSNKYAKKNGYRVYYSTLGLNLNNTKFCGNYNINLEKIGSVMEIYEKKKINFYVPIEKTEDFKLYGKPENVEKSE